MTSQQKWFKCLLQAERENRFYKHLDFFVLISDVMQRTVASGVAMSEWVGECVSEWVGQWVSVCV